MEEVNTRINNNSVSYFRKASGNPEVTVIFVHGFPFDKTIWNKQLDELPATVEGLAYDIRGYGSSTTDHLFFNLDLFANDLIEFIAHLKLRNCVLCGVSMGGYIALRAFELSPEVFIGLILCDTNCVADSNEAKVKRFNSIEQLQAGNKADFIEGFVKNVFSENTLANSVTTVHYLKNLISQTSNDTICATQLALAARTDTSSVLPGIQIPTLIIRGESDKLMSEEQTLQLHKGISNSELVYISRSGHLPNLENATEFNLALTDFLHKHFLA